MGSVSFYLNNNEYAYQRDPITGNSFIELQSCIPAGPVVLCAALRIEQLSSVLVKWQLSGLK